MTRCVLIVVDDPVQRRLIEERVRRIDLRFLSATGGALGLDALERPASAEIAAVVLAVAAPGRDAPETLSRLRRRLGDVPVIVEIAEGSADASEAVKRAGAFEVLAGPAGPEQLRAAIRKAMARGNAGEASGADLFETSRASPALSPVLALARKAARSNIPVLIGGETGVGKEWIARAIQASGHRAKKPFVAVNCGALPGDLVESILFGHAKGAFTDASQRHEGKFVEADGGTLFLDEVGELSASAQVKLLRVLQDGEIAPLGASRAVRTDVRILSATNRDLGEAVSNGQFREDLLYRLNAFELIVPPLRERTGEIAGLARLFVGRHVAVEPQTPVRGISDAALAVLSRYQWPGNIRQLENTIRRAVVLGESETLTEADFRDIAKMAESGAPATAASGAMFEATDRGGVEAGRDRNSVHPSNGRSAYAGFVERRRSWPPFAVRDGEGDIRSIEEIEAELIRLAIAQYDGRMSEVARRLRIGRSTLYRKMREYEIDVR